MTAYPPPDDGLRQYRERIARLDDMPIANREELARSLGDAPACFALAPLIRLLNDGEESVSIAAARSLGRLGDARAAPALTAALRRDRSPCAVAMRVLIVCVAAGAAPLASLLLYRLVGAASLLVILPALLIGLANFYCFQRESSRHSAALVTALSQIAAASPSRDMTPLLPHLERVARDRLWQTPRTRAASRTAMRSIGAFLEASRNLPSPAAPAPDGSDLPRPARRKV